MTGLTMRRTEKMSDFKKKHMPVLKGPDPIAVNEYAEVRVEVGSLLPHDSATLSVFSWNRDSRIGPPHFIERIELLLNGKLLKSSRPEESRITMNPAASFRIRPHESGIISARALCSLHGFVESVQQITVE